MDKIHIDKLSADMLDDDFVGIFRAIHFTQCFLGTLQVKIQYGFVTEMAYGYEVFCLFVWLIQIVSLFIFTISCDSTNDSMLTDFYLKLAHILKGLIIAAMSFHSFCKGSAHSKFYVSLQKIDHAICMKGAMLKNKQMTLLSRISVALTVIASITWAVVLNFYMVKELCLASLIIQIPIFGNYIDMILIFFTIYYIAIRVEYINSILKEKLHISSSFSESSDKTFFISNHCLDPDTALWNRLINSFQNIVKAIEELHDVHQFTIFGLTCEFLIVVMILVESLITRIKQQLPLDIHSITVVVPALIFLFFILLLCVVGELLNSKIDQSRKLCTSILCVSNGASRSYIKRLLLLLDVKLSISIYDIFTLDAQLPLNLFAVTATYTIVLLQFALL